MTDRCCVPGCHEHARQVKTAGGTTYACMRHMLIAMGGGDIGE